MLAIHRDHGTHLTGSVPKDQRVTEPHRPRRARVSSSRPKHALRCVARTFRSPIGVNSTETRRGGRLRGSADEAPARLAGGRRYTPTPHFHTVAWPQVAPALHTGTVRVPSAFYPCPGVQNSNAARNAVSVAAPRRYRGHPDSDIAETLRAGDSALLPAKLFRGSRQPSPFWNIWEHPRPSPAGFVRKQRDLSPRDGCTPPPSFVPMPISGVPGTPRLLGPGIAERRWLELRRENAWSARIPCLRWPRAGRQAEEARPTPRCGSDLPGDARSARWRHGTWQEGRGKHGLTQSRGSLRPSSGSKQTAPNSR